MGLGAGESVGGGSVLLGVGVVARGELQEAAAQESRAIAKMECGMKVRSIAWIPCLISNFIIVI
jgi:hypothetical protein